MERFCPLCHRELSELDFDGQSVDFCGGCRGIHCDPGELEAIVGRAVTRVVDRARDDEKLRCVSCGDAMVPMLAGAACWHACACGAAFLESGAMQPLKQSAGASLAPSGRPPSLAARAATSAIPAVVRDERAAEKELSGSRFAFDKPIALLGAYPVAFFFALLVGVLGVGEIFFIFVRIWIHEFGHALPAWLSSRAALPLPFGWTSWSEESSIFTGLCFAFLVGVFGYRSFKEGRRAGMVLAGVLFALQIFCTFVMESFHMKEWIVAGGQVGELVLSTFLIVAFYYRPPDRFRWDFFRFVALIPAAIVFASAFSMWVRIEQGAQDLPFGSIVGSPGDGTGDIDRLLADYGWTRGFMIGFFRSLGSVCLLVIGGHYAFFGVRTWWRQRDGAGA